MLLEAIVGFCVVSVGVAVAGGVRASRAANEKFASEARSRGFVALPGLGLGSADGKSRVRLMATRTSGWFAVEVDDHPLANRTSIDIRQELMAFGAPLLGVDGKVGDDALDSAWHFRAADFDLLRSIVLDPAVTAVLAPTTGAHPLSRIAIDEKGNCRMVFLTSIDATRSIDNLASCLARGVEVAAVFAAASHLSPRLLEGTGSGTAREGSSIGVPSLR